MASQHRRRRWREEKPPPQSRERRPAGDRTAALKKVYGNSNRPLNGCSPLLPQARCAPPRAGGTP